MSRSTASTERDQAWTILHATGWTDYKIARAFEIGESAVRRWRGAQSLPPNGVRKIANVDYGVVLRLYRDGHNDHEIAREVGIDPSTICKWRRSKGLPAQKSADPSLDAAAVRKAKKMLRLGATKEQVAAEISVHKRTIQRIRSKMSDAGLRKHGLNTLAVQRQARAGSSLLTRIENAIGKKVPSNVRYEAALALYTEVLEGRIAPDYIEQQAPRFRNEAWSLCGSRFGPRSLDEENDDGWSLGDALADPAALEDLERAAELAYDLED